MGSARERPRAANIFDVARLAGVSHQTVSRVVNDHPNVKDSTRERVNQAIQQLRYRPNTAARAMVTRRSRNLGLITSGAPDYGPSSTVQGFTTAAREARYTVSISTSLDTDPESMREAIELLLGQHVEAIILVASRQGFIDSINSLNVEVPVITVDSGDGRSRTESVSFDQYAGARMATEHLISLGHREISHIGGPSDSGDAQERARGYQDAMAQHGLVTRPVLRGDWSPTSGYAAIASFSGELTATGYFCANDQMALGAIHALKDRGWHVPDDVSIVGFDDIPEAEHLDPPLTTIRQDFRRLGERVMAMVLSTLNDKDATSIRIPLDLIIRGSSVPVHTAVSPLRGSAP